MKLPRLPLEIINKILFNHKGIQTPSGKIISTLIDKLIPEHETMREIDEEKYANLFIILYFHGHRFF